MTTVTTGTLEGESDIRAAVDVHENAPATSAEVRATVDGYPLFARSPVMRDVLATLSRATESSQIVCFVGEAGTGREVLARELQRLAAGNAGRFLIVDCRGGMVDRIDGAVVAATSFPGQSMVYLAHVGEMPLESQARLVRLVREHRAPAPGRDRRVRFSGSLDVSVVAATEDGRLLPELADLMLPIEVPALRQRKLDIPLLADHLIAKAAAERGSAPRVFSRAAGSLLSALPWPGNTPELAALVGLLAGSVDRAVVELDDVLGHLRLASYADRAESGLTLRKAREQFERECISAALAKHRGRMADAAQALGIQRTNLYRKIRQLKVPRSGRPTQR